MDTSAIPAETVWHRTVPLSELPEDGSGCTFELGGRQVAVFRTEDGVHACDDTCPHAGASLGAGVVIEGEVACPWHSFHFDLQQGANTDGLDLCIDVFPTRLGEDQVVEVGLAPGGGGAQDDAAPDA